MATKCLLLAAFLLLVTVGAEAAPLATVTGKVPCSTGSSINVAEAPVFPNADVELMCGGRVIAGTTTDGSGSFTLELGQATSTLLTSVLANQCKMVVVTPLAQCDVSLADVSGTLAAPVQIMGLAADTSGGALGGLGGVIGIVTGLLGGLLGNVIGIVTSSFSVV